MSESRQEQGAGQRGVEAGGAPAAQASWTFFTNHSHVLFCLARDGDQTVRRVAAQVGITERAVQRIIGELEEAGALLKRREGRRNRYVVNPQVALRHPVEAHCRLTDLIALVVGAPRGEGGT
jgi:DNA-binding transcriptional ArsR family regulator